MLELTIRSCEIFTVDPNIVETVTVDPVSVEKNPLPRNSEETVAVDVTREDPFMVLNDAFNALRVDTVIVEFATRA